MYVAAIRCLYRWVTLFCIHIIFFLLFYRNGPSSHYSGSSSRGQGSSALNSSWKSEAPLSPKPGSASNPNLGSSAADILSVKSSSLYLNNDDRRNAASPVSTSSSTSSKKFWIFPPIIIDNNMNSENLWNYWQLNVKLELIFILDLPPNVIQK